jgi:antitoxin MazE
MTYKQKLTKIGNSIGIILPKTLLDALNMDLGTELYVEGFQDRIILDKKEAVSVSPDFLRIAEGVGEKYKDAFKDLASK